MLTAAQLDYLDELADAVYELGRANENLEIWDDEAAVADAAEWADDIAVDQDRYDEALKELREVVARFNTVMGDA